MEKGTTTNGVVTDIDGNYTIEIPADGMLAVSYIGCKDQDIKVNGREVINVNLADDNKVLEEVVVVGYGVQKKRDVSTAVSSVKAEALANNPSTDFRQALAGKMPGVQVTVPSGDPEGSVSIRVRGVSTVNAGSDPLYVVDGVPMERGFANLNTNDIESVEVLKDASAAAIYGSRGSNGVVLVTTKKATIDSCCRSILQNFNRLNIVGVQVGKTTLHRNAIYYIERVATGVDGTYTTNANAYATLWVSARYCYLYTRHLTSQSLTEVGRRIVGKSLCLDRRHSSRYVALLLHAITYNHNFFQYLIIICQVNIDYFATIYLDVLVLAANV
jgi:TonB-dependent SusC/RagA subfamily outer membrane receptor